MRKETTETREVEMLRIVRSEITKQGVEIEWSDHIIYTFNVDSNVEKPEFASLSKPYTSFVQPTDRLAVSLTSANATLNGCGIKS